MAPEALGMRLATSALHAAVLASLIAACLPVPALAQADTSGPTEAEFRDPPQEARPRVWWHWLNGNVTREGISKDLEWMQRVGIGGVQTFDINFQTPDVVDRRLAYMTPEWKDAFRFAAQESDRLGLELTIASSPGWSLTGGPWVKPKDGMKKLVWSETVLRGGDRGPIVLAPPPNISGPFQTIPLKPEPGADPNQVPPTSYRDIAVLAYRAAPPVTLPTPEYRVNEGEILDAGRLTDGELSGGISIKRDRDNGATISITYAKPQTVRSLAAYLPGAADMFTGPALDAALEASEDGKSWRTIAKFRPTLVPSTIAFAPVTARSFRLQLTSIDTLSPIDLMSAPGYAGVNYAMYLRSMPLQIAELELQAQQRLDQFEAKAGFGIARDYYALKAQTGSDPTGIAPGDILDLTARMRADGTLDWTPPHGDWRILRMGWSLTGKTNHPAPAEATGLEVDKLDGQAVRAYMDAYLANYRAAVGPDLMGKQGVNAILTDSTEAGAFNWTPGMLRQFERLRGYDPRPYLPTLTGTIVGSREKSDQFLYDFRRTIADLHATEHYGMVSKAAHEAGLEVYGEALEGWRVSLGDDIDMRSFTDVPMAAMWAFPPETGPRPLLIADLRTAASSAHIRGKPFVAAESMTSSRFPWAQGPAELRSVVDTEFANGINRIVIHTSPHQPIDDKQPGLSLRHIGQAFDRHETWAEMARPWIDYIARSSYLLQQGRFVADVAYFPGEEAPVPTLVSEGRITDLPQRYGYDFVSASTLLDHVSAEGKDLVTDGGARYRVLFLSGTSDRMTVPVLRRIAQLASEGATIVGVAPSSTPSLADNPKEFRALVGKLWRDKSVTKVGKGRVIANTDVEQALAMIGVAPDIATLGGSPASAPSGIELQFVHRSLADGDIYFVRNPGVEPLSLEVRFRVTGKTPELWDAVTGEIRPLTYRNVSDHTVVSLDFAGEESQFIVFRKRSVVPSVTLGRRDLDAFAQINGPWLITFETGRGAPTQVHMDQLAPLNANADPGIRYFSGIATYRTSFSLPEDYKAGDALLVDLGEVGDLAEVRVNGQSAGTAWQAPYRIDISRLVKPGSNELEIGVANLWANRLIGDAQPTARKIGWTAAPMYKADAPLRPAGLIGPVRLLQVRVEAN